MDKRELLLRKRIARLESLVRASKFSTKNEGLTYDQRDRISDAVWEYADQFDDLDERAEELQLLADRDRTAMDEVLDMLDLDDMQDDMEVVEQAIAYKADEILSDPDCWDDYFDEACSRRKMGRRRMKRESRRSIKREAVLTLPNGMPATTVADVLSGWADTDYHRPEDAIRKLRMAETFDGSGRRENVLAKATNRWYPTEEDVAEAIEDCWRDPVNSSLAKLFASDFGDYTQMALSIMPAASSSGSRTQDITLKFQWKNPTRDW